jgi:hypothetical protein
MKKRSLLIMLALATVLAWAVPVGHSQEKSPAAAPKYEYAVVKWDGPDRVYYNLPEKFELVYLSKTGVKIPQGAQAEEWCLAYVANVMAKEGWEALNINSRRILFRRAKG